MEKRIGRKSDFHKERHLSHMIRSQIQAGDEVVADNMWDLPEAVTARARLKNHTIVVHAIREAWVTCLECAHQAKVAAEAEAEAAAAPPSLSATNSEVLHARRSISELVSCADEITQGISDAVAARERAGRPPPKPPPPKPRTFSREAFFTFYRKLYLAQAVALGEAYVRPRDCAEIAQDDWERDSAGG